MSRLIFLSRDKFGTKYRENTLSGWNYLPDKYQGKGVTEIKEHFTQGTDFTFTDDRGGEAVFYAVNKNKGMAETNLDGKQLPLAEDYFLPYSEQIAYLRQFSDRDLDRDVDKLPSDFQKLQLLKKHAGEGELSNLSEQIQERMTPEKIREFCKGHSERCYNKPAIVDFLP